MEHAADPVDLCARLVRTPGESGSEEHSADVIAAAMAELGYRAIERDELGSVTGLIGPSGDRPALLLDGHLDVVPVTGSWTVDPFGAEIRDGRLYGRGATDMKAGVAAAACGLAEAAHSGQLARPVALSASVLEETVEGVALGRVLDRLQPEAVVICEPSRLRLMTAQRGRLELQVSARGTPAHAAYPEQGRNAVVLAAAAVTALERLAAPVDPLLGAGILVPTDVISDPWPSISLLPGSVTVRLDRRTVRGETAESVIAAIDECLAGVAEGVFSVGVTAGPVTACTGVTIRPPRALAAWSTDAASPLLLAAQRVMERAGLPGDGGAWGFCTNGSESAGARGLPTIGLGPGSPDEAHLADESVDVDDVRRACALYRDLAVEVSHAR